MSASCSIYCRCYQNQTWIDFSMILFYIVALYERYRENWKRPNTFVHYLYILITINIDNKLNKRLTWACITHRFIIQWLFITWFVVSKILLLFHIKQQCKTKSYWSQFMSDFDNLCINKSWLLFSIVNILRLHKLNTQLN
jgi:hypothetical protein